jgi:hypothetical protein
MTTKRVAILAVSVCAICFLAFKGYAYLNKVNPHTGQDVDSHGCIGSAGYSWDEEIHRCRRPWDK